MKHVSTLFREEILNNTRYAQALQDLYNDKYNAIVQRDFVRLGKMLKLPNLNPEIK